jgi:hypothetical protein
VATRGALLPGAPVDQNSAGRIIPGDRIPSERVEVIRFEAKAQAPSSEDEPEEEETRVYTGRARRRPALRGGLAGAPQEPNASPRAQDDSSPTLPSRGNGPPGAEPDDGSIVVEARHADGSPLSNRLDSDPDSDER